MKKQTIKKIRRVFGVIAFVSLLYSLGVIGALEIGSITPGVGILRTLLGVASFAFFSYFAGYWY